MKKIKFERPQLVNLTNTQKTSGFCGNGSEAGNEIIAHCDPTGGAGSLEICGNGFSAFGLRACSTGSNAELQSP